LKTSPLSEEEEVANKKELFSHFVPEILKTLIKCLKDKSWAVRASASLSAAYFTITYPDESKEFNEEINKLWFDHLGDNIGSMREHSAIAIVLVLKHTNSEELLSKVKDFIDSNLMKAKNQNAKAPS
jgi:hypothetical protein